MYALPHGQAGPVLPLGRHPPLPPANEKALHALQRHLILSERLIQALKAQVTPAAGQQAILGHVAQSTSNELDQLAAEVRASEGGLHAIAQEEDHYVRVQQHLLQAQQQLKKTAADAWKACYDALHPIMVDSLLRYIATSKYPDWIINHSISPSNFRCHFKHYPRRLDIKTLEDNGVLSHSLATTLLKGVQKVPNENLYLGQYQRNSAAHPTLLNGLLEKYAGLLEHHEGGWRSAVQHFANLDPQKTLAEDRLAADRFGSWRHEAEPFAGRLPPFLSHY
ncbi:hypothetical protein JCM10213_003388 [Rhodosporidiobolus nylandii]